jgi:hypothetical protein
MSSLSKEVNFIVVTPTQRLGSGIIMRVARQLLLAWTALCALAEHEVQEGRGSWIPATSLF